MTPAPIVQHLAQQILDAPLRLYFGGSFDPPHLGHAQLPPRVLGELGYPNGWLVYVPAARSPHKQSAPSPDRDRLQMLQIALRNRPRCVIWDTELVRAGTADEHPSYWAETWEAVRALRADGLDRFLIGADQARSMHRWHRYELFWRDAVVMLRGTHDEPQQLLDSLASSGAWDDEQLAHWQSSIVQVPMIDASSTRIREALHDPSSRKNPIAGLDDRVHDYILEHGLYQN